MANFNKWCYSTNITDHSTYSVGNKNDRTITKITLKEAIKNVIKIKKIRKDQPSKITEIQIINIETNKTIDPTINKPKKI
ncbi:hypothetical protein LCGC14_1654080 [marine sediment metagenome]|uniref:Uncharacterized protein n=1 Tax=marine sediment metagenome TaxID=412755 RepID=A0A0F9HWS2_9ZZZZ